MKYRFFEQLQKEMNLAEFADFLQEVADGEEVSKGKNPLDKSKEQKAADDEETEEVPAEGEEAEAEAGVAPPVVDPASAPGSQVSIGKKEIDKGEDPEAQKVAVGKDKEEKINLKPRIDIHQTF